MSNSNIALYRKYRPSNFNEVIGQDHIVKAISGALSSGKIAHAYLLCGPRGTGKTTIARIIAKELGVSINDTYELDAASNRGIDDIREIRSNVLTLPFESKYKIYILDEVHMFTKDAWNALLKTIEEPPNHVIFILATTELEKVPETIISRCQNFTLKKPTENVISTVVSEIAKKEGYEIEEGGIFLISLLADGAFRDALGILQKVISYSKNKKITLKEIEDVTGSPNSTLVNNFINSLVTKNLEAGLNSIQKASSQNLDMIVFLKMIVSKLRHLLILRYSPSLELEIKKEISGTDFDYLKNIVKDKPELISSRTLTILLEAYQAQKNSVIMSLPLEIALVNIINE